MKTILWTILVLTVFVSSEAQTVTITTKDGKEVNTTISGVSNSALFTPNGTFKYSDIQTATFESKKQQDQTTYDRLVAGGATVQFTGQSIVMKPTPEQEVDISTLVNSLEQFRKQRNTGKGLQLAGFGLLAAAIAINSQSSATTDTKSAQSVAIAGGVIGVIGFVVDLDAGHHLKLKK